MKKRWIALILAAALVSLPACSATLEARTASPTPNESPSEDTATSEPPSADPSDPVEIVFSTWGDPSEQDSMQAAIDVFNNRQDKIHVTVTQMPHETYAVDIQTMFEAGSLPDCGMVEEGTAIGWARQGLLKEYDIYEGQEEKPFDYLAFKNGGQTVAYSTANEILCLWYNKKMFDDASVPYPPSSLDMAWTWDEFVATAKLLTLDANGRNATEAGFDASNIVQYGAYVNQWAWQLEVWALSNGGRFFSEDGNTVVFDDAAIEGLQKVVDLHLKDGVAPFIDGTMDGGFYRSLGAGNVAMCTDGQWTVGNRQSSYNPEGTEIDYGVAVLPYMKTKANICVGSPVGLFATTEHPEEAAEFLRWYGNPENNMNTIEAGWWMPNLTSWYTDADLLAQWIAAEPRVPLGDAYQTAVVDVALDTSVMQSTCWFYTPNTSEILKTLLPGKMVEAIYGDKTVKQVIDENRAAMQEILDRQDDPFRW